MAVTGGGAVEVQGVKSISDSSSTFQPFTIGAGTPTGNFTAIGVNNPNPGHTSGFFYRLGGTMVLHDGLGVETVTFDMFLENRSNEGTARRH